MASLLENGPRNQNGLTKGRFEVDEVFTGHLLFSGHSLEGTRVHSNADDGIEVEEDWQTGCLERIKRKALISVVSDTR